MRRQFIILIATIIIASIFISMFFSYLKLLNPMSGIWTVALRADRPEKSEVILQGLDKEVQVYWDAWGVPHIYAASEDDLFYAFGYVQAVDRLFEMDFYSRVAEGRLSEVFGESAYSTDFFFRTIGLNRAANLTMKNLNRYDLRLLERFSLGVNAAITEMEEEDNLPLEFRFLDHNPALWEPIRTIALSKFIAWMLTGDFIDLEFARIVDSLGYDDADELFPVDRPYEINILPDLSRENGLETPPNQSFSDTSIVNPKHTTKFEGIESVLTKVNEVNSWTESLRLSFGSNNWVVDGNITSTGKPLLANDPHLDLTVPSVWYEAHLVLENESGVVLNVRGVTFPGYPLIVIGFNEYLGWGITNVGADVIDFYTYNWRMNRSEYWYIDHWEKVEKAREIIKIKGGKDQLIYVNLTRHGPLIEGEDEFYVLKWTGHQPSTLIRATHRFNFARDLQEFIEGIAEFHLPGQNIVYADTIGNIAYFAAGKYPKRTNVESLKDLRLPFNGSIGQGEWSDDMIDPPWEIPYVINPPWHFVVTANNRPAGTSYPDWLGWSWEERYRAQRITELINAVEEIDTEYMKKIQMDTLSIPARELTPYIIDAYNDRYSTIEDEDLRGIVEEAIEHLASWNFTIGRSMVAPTIFNGWLKEMKEMTFRDDYGRAGIKDEVRYPTTQVLEYFIKENITKWFDDISTPEVEIRDETIFQSLVKAVEGLIGDLGGDISKWEWGRIHKLTAFHPLGQALSGLNYPQYSLDGDEYTVRVAPGFFVFRGPSWREVLDLSNLDRSVGILPGGQSGDPFSPNWNDQLEMWIDGKTRILAIPPDPSEIGDTKYIIILRPEG